MAGHILHLAMPPLRQPFEEPRLDSGEIRVSEADRLETQARAPFPNLRGERGIVHDVRS